jgi:hypothetical protein
VVCSVIGAGLTPWGGFSRGERRCLGEISGVSGCIVGVKLVLPSTFEGRSGWGREKTGGGVGAEVRAGACGAQAGVLSGTDVCHHQFSTSAAST